MSYTSQGTIGMKCAINGADPTTTIYFIPGNSYSIKHGNKRYAVFVNPTANSAIIKEYDPDTGKGVELQAAAIGCTGIISSAAVHQIKVEISVEETGGKFDLRSIAVPAK